MPEQRSKLIAVITGVISLILGIGYLILVQFLDSRGEMLPAPPLAALWQAHLFLGWIHSIGDGVWNQTLL